MPTEKPRVTITVPEEQLRKIEEFRFRTNQKNQTQAILALVETGLEELMRQDARSIRHASEPSDPIPESDSNSEAFADMLHRAGLIPQKVSISEQDHAFLKAMFLAIRAHFQVYS